MTEATTTTTTRHHDLHTYKTLSPESLTKHESRTVEHQAAHPDGSVSLSLMSEIGDGTFVAWSTCTRCTKHYTVCTCAEGPKEPDYIVKWKTRRFPASFDARPELGAGRELVPAVVAALRERGYVVGEIPPPKTVIKEVEIDRLFTELYKAVADSSAPEGTQVDDVLAEFQAEYDRIVALRPTVTAQEIEEWQEQDGPPDFNKPAEPAEPVADEPIEEAAAVTEDDRDFARETLGEEATPDEVEELAGERAERDLNEIVVDF